MIDLTTRWPEVASLASISAESCVRAFLSTWILRFGIPAILTSDRPNLPPPSGPESVPPLEA